MTWQIYNKNLRKSPLLVEYFSFLDKFDPILSSVIDDPNKKTRINLPVSAKIINFAARIGLKTCR